MEALEHRVHENIQAIEELRAEAEREATRQQLLIERAARVLARPLTLALLLGAVVTWIVANTLADSPVDAPPFFWLQGALAMYAASVTTMLLIVQARQTRDDQRRAHLELHVNLLAEQKATKIIALLEELRHDLPNVRDRDDSEAEALAEEVDPRTVHTAIASDADKHH